MDWVPTISEWSGPIYARIVDALAADIALGRVRRGQQLPTHRALATALAIDLTTVTRAYGEARRRGLIEARVGLGTFVSETTARPSGDIPHPVKIDLSMNIPPHPIEANLDTRIAQGLAQINDTSSFTAYLSYCQPGGSREERALAAEWLRPRAPRAQGERLLIYPGTQAILFNLLLTLTTPGDVVLTETLTFPGMIAAAAARGVRLIGVPMDSEGVLPDALRAACEVHRPRAVYLVPTLHNPTTATMSSSRRQAVAEVIMKSDAWLIEDDAYGLLDRTVAPISNLIPERSFLAMSLSKCIAPALRVAFLQLPNAASEQQMRASLQATMQMPPPLMVALVMQWIRSGVADQIIAAIRHEAIGRQQLASKILRGLDYESRPSAHHLWLRLPGGWDRADFASHLLREGLAVVRGDTFAVGEVPHAVRVSLGAARNRAELVQALHVLVNAIHSPASGKQIV